MHLVNGMFNLISILTKQEIQLLRMLTRSNPYSVYQRSLLEYCQCRYIFNARHLGAEIYFREEGRIQSRAAVLLEQACLMLKKINSIGLEAALEQGFFADIKRSRDGGKGRDGVVHKAADYYNPFPALFMGKAAGGPEGVQ